MGFDATAIRWKVRSRPCSARWVPTASIRPPRQVCGRSASGWNRSPRTRRLGATEVWEFYNTTGDAHPMHVHEVVFEVVNREGSGAG